MSPETGETLVMPYYRRSQRGTKRPIHSERAAVGHFDSSEHDPESNLVRRIEDGSVKPFPADRRFRERLWGSVAKGTSAIALSWPTKRNTVDG